MKAQIVSFHCILSNSTGQHISSTFNRDVITQSQQKDAPLMGLAEGLQNLRKGEKRRIFVAAARAYGFYDPSLMIDVPRERFPRSSLLRVGDQIKWKTLNSHRIYTLTRIAGTTVTLDANHPLAGQDLIFDIEAVDARDATKEEIEESNKPTPSTKIH